MGYNTKRLVETALSWAPELRNDDRELTLYIWEQQGLKLDKAQTKAFMQASSMDFISRRRRELMSKYPPSKEADERRHTHFNEELDRYRTRKSFDISFGEPGTAPLPIPKSNWFTKRFNRDEAK